MEVLVLWYIHIYKHYIRCFLNSESIILYKHIRRKNSHLTLFILGLIRAHIPRSLKRSNSSPAILEPIKQNILICNMLFEIQNVIDWRRWVITVKIIRNSKYFNCWKYYVRIKKFTIYNLEYPGKIKQMCPKELSIHN